MGETKNIAWADKIVGSMHQTSVECPTTSLYIKGVAQAWHG
jgi:hypothetical protein